ncbi:MAG: hypothetical protein RQ748_06665 [Elusimicrobiales bacterium]|nr:hypothetical protein [Elusimicrobiales bacterium]
MGINFVFTIDGDWDEYFSTRLGEAGRRPSLERELPLVAAELDMAAAVGGRFVHFVHTSPLTRDFFLRPEFTALWKRAEASGGEVGVHCHEEDLYSAWHYADPSRMEPAIGDLVRGLRAAGLAPISYRGGFMAFGPAVIPLLEANGLPLDFSCAPDRHLVTNGALVSDWRGAPANVYRMDRSDHRKRGDSAVFEIPLGIYIERQSLWTIWKRCRELAAAKEEVIVTVLAHTYDFSSWKMKLKIRAALEICKAYGTFVNPAEALKKIKELGL